MLLDVRVEHSHLQVPVSLLIDDPAPCVNPYYYHRRLRQKDGEPTLASGEAYVHSVVDNLMSRDLATGRIPALVTAGGGVTLLTHWQSLYSQGRATGLLALEETLRRIADAFGPRVAWRSCSELAARTAATAALRWTAEQTDATLCVALQSSFDCAGFTVSLACKRKPRRVRLLRESGPANGESVDLPAHPAGRLPLPTQRHTWRAGRLAVCFDLHGPVRIDVEW